MENQQSTNLGLEDSTVAAPETALPVAGTDEIVQSVTEVHSEIKSPKSEVGELVQTLDLFNAAVESQVEDAVTQWVGFDPAIHAVNPDGTPRMRTNGSYALKRGRKSAGADTGWTAADTGDGAGADQAATAPAAIKAAASSVSNKQTAVFLVDTVTGILGKAIGPEWLAEKDEKKGLSSATEQYLDAKGGLQITPEMGLLLAVSAYAVPRMAVPNTQTKLSKFVGWCSDRIAVIRARFGR